MRFNDTTQSSKPINTPPAQTSSANNTPASHANKEVYSKTTSRNSFTCNYCKKSGHTEDNCYAKARIGRNITKTNSVLEDDNPSDELELETNTDSEENNVQPSTKRIPLTEFCSGVFKLEHKVNTTETTQVAASVKHCSSQVPISQVTLNGSEDTAMFDTESETTLVSYDTFHTLGLKLDKKKVGLIRAGCSPLEV